MTSNTDVFKDFADGKKPWTQGVVDVLAERDKQHEQFGDSHDDMATGSQIAKAAINYATASIPELSEMTDRLDGGGMWSPSMAWAVAWPWDASWWKPKSRRRNLIKAAALLMAEIDRLDRAEKVDATPAVD